MRIIAIALRYYKCYQSTQLIKLFSNDEKFVGFIGENGVGKSAVLQAFNSFFTGQNWIRNKTGKKGASECGIAPVAFCDIKFLQKKKFSDQEITVLRKGSNTIKKNLEELNLKMDENIIFLSCMLFQNGKIEMFDGTQIVKNNQSVAKKIRDLFLSYFKYIYIDAEINIDTSVDINSKTFELIKGSGVVKDIEKELKRITIKYKGKKLSISDLINNIVIQYLDNEVVSKLKEVDKDYDYKNLKTGAQSKMSERLIGELATRALFNNRELTKEIQGKSIGISYMSSGQRRKAFLDFVSVMISNLDDEVKNRTILAIDEPEISVDASSRIQQFEKLRQLSNQGVNVLFTTHWYGWIMQLIDGSSILLKENSDGREIYQSSIFDFSDLSISNIKQHKMRMMFDFLSSLGSWAENDTKQKFIICEGRTDFNYINKHFLKKNYKTIPVRGSEVIKLYKIFTDFYFRDNKKPLNIVFLIDTDPDKSALLQDLDGDNLKRISRDSDGKVVITNGKKNLAEKCDIDDLLSPDPFLKALKDNIDILDKNGSDFIESLAVKHGSETGLRAFGLDDIDKMKFKKIYKKNFKLKVSESYQPKEDEKKVFKDIFKIF